MHNTQQQDFKMVLRERSLCHLAVSAKKDSKKKKRKKKKAIPEKRKEKGSSLEISLVQPNKETHPTL